MITATMHIKLMGTRMAPTKLTSKATATNPLIVSTVRIAVLAKIYSLLMKASSSVIR